MGFSMIPGSCFRFSGNFSYFTSKKEHLPNMIYLIEDGIKCSSAKPVDLMFVVDGSGSVGDAAFKQGLDWVKTVTKEIFNGRTGRAGLIQYSSIYATTIEVPLKDYDRNYFNKQIDGILYDRGATYTANALNYTFNELDKSGNLGKSTIASVVIVITDGKTQDRDSLGANAKRLTDKEVYVFAVGVGGSVDESELRTIAQGNNKRVFTVGDYVKLNDILRQLSTAVTEISPEGSITSKMVGNELRLAQLGFSSATGNNKV